MKPKRCDLCWGIGCTGRHKEIGEQFTYELDGTVSLPKPLLERLGEDYLDKLRKPNETLHRRSNKRV